MAEYVKSEKRNHNGVKNCAAMYCTFDGEVYPAWTSFPSAERIKAYRAAGVMCRKIGEELYVRLGDHETAAAIDDAKDRTDGR